MNQEIRNYKDLADLLVNGPLYSSVLYPSYKPVTSTSRSFSPGVPFPSEVHEEIFKLPSIEIHCTSDQCGGLRNFNTTHPEPKLSSTRATEETIIYICKNCTMSFKTYWLSFSLLSKGLIITKLGENPPFGPPIPSKLNSILKNSRDLFFNGRKCESEGLGIGAFAYYRRVLDNQKNAIIDELIKAAETINADEPFITSLKSAKTESGFAKSVDKIRPVIPDDLMLKGHNPLSLLNTALSKGIHSKDDEECLKISQDIRIILTNLVVKLSDLSKKDKELQEAITNINNFHNPQ